jgi:hypothetical protein
MPRTGMRKLLYLAIALVALDGCMTSTPGSSGPAARNPSSGSASGGTPAATPTLAGIGRPIALSGHTAPITALAWSPDGKTLA